VRCSNTRHATHYYAPSWECAFVPKAAMRETRPAKLIGKV